MKTPEQLLADRVRELRRRHFGPRGKAEFAQRLGLTPDEYARFERGVVPPGAVMVRMCEATGEDLQWLLTGVAARGTVVISGTRTRHQDLLSHLAKLLDEQPRFAAPVEAFLDLLARGGRAASEAPLALPLPKSGELIPIFAEDELPDALPEPCDSPGGGFWLASPSQVGSVTQRKSASLAEPATDYDDRKLRAARLLTIETAEGQTHRCLHSPELARCFPGMFGVRLTDDAMEPMFRAGDAVLVAVGAEPRIGRAALCKFGDEPGIRCRIWLGQDESAIHLGRLRNGEHERAERAKLCWSLEVLYRLAPAA